MGKFRCNVLDIIHYIYIFAWICICNRKLLNYDLTTSDVSTKVVDEIIKLDLGIKIASIRIFPNYLKCLCKNVFTMIR